MGRTYLGSNSVSQEIKNMYIGVDGVARKIKAGYIGVNGVAKQIYSAEWKGHIVIPYNDIPYVSSSNNTANPYHGVYYLEDFSPSETGNSLSIQKVDISNFESHSVCFFKNKIFVGGRYNDNLPAVAYIENGEKISNKDNWNKVEIGNISGYLTGLATNGEIIVAVVRGVENILVTGMYYSPKAHVYYSEDGINWTNANVGGSANTYTAIGKQGQYCIKWVKDTFYLLLTSGTWKSSNGKNWSRMSTINGVTQNYAGAGTTDIDYFNGEYYLVTTGGNENNAVFDVSKGTSLTNAPTVLDINADTTEYDFETSYNTNINIIEDKLFVGAGAYTVDGINWHKCYSNSNGSSYIQTNVSVIKINDTYVFTDRNKAYGGKRLLCVTTLGGTYKAISTNIPVTQLYEI